LFILSFLSIHAPLAGSDDADGLTIGFI